MTGNAITPRYSEISNIIQGVETEIEFDDEHDFVLYEIVSFRITPAYGMTQLNNVQTKVIGVSSTSILVNIDSRNFTPFVVPDDLHKTTPPICVPSASGTNDDYTKTVILNDAFDNVRT